MESRILVLGAGFGGLELATLLSDAFGDNAGVTLIEGTDSFVFGSAKLDVMFAKAAPEDVRLRYADFGKPGVRLLRETITAIDPEARRVTTNAGTHEADFLVVALGADYDFDATPGLAESGSEFYSVGGAERMREMLPTFTRGRAIVGVCGAPFKCPPAPSEAALLSHEYLPKSNTSARAAEPAGSTADGWSEISCWRRPFSCRRPAARAIEILRGFDSRRLHFPVQPSPFSIATNAPARPRDPDDPFRADARVAGELRLVSAAQRGAVRRHPRAVDAPPRPRA
jgi:hypothetical protein